MVRRFSKKVRKTPRRYFPRVRKPYVFRRFKRYGGRKYNTHVYKRFDEISATGPKTISCNFGALGYTTDSRTFTLSDVTDYQEFTVLYDKYMITGVKVYFDYTPDAAAPGGPTVWSGPKLWIKIDKDNSTLPTLDEMTGSTQVKCIRFTTSRPTQSIFLRPHVLTELYNGVGSTAYGDRGYAWCDCDTGSIPHYGLKLLAQGAPSQNLGAITMRFKYYLKFRGVQ